MIYHKDIQQSSINDKIKNYHSRRTEKMEGERVYCTVVAGINFNLKSYEKDCETANSFTLKLYMGVQEWRSVWIFEQSNRGTRQWQLVYNSYVLKSSLKKECSSKVFCYFHILLYFFLQIHWRSHFIQNSLHQRFRTKTRVSRMSMNSPGM